MKLLRKKIIKAKIMYLKSIGMRRVIVKMRSGLRLMRKRNKIKKLRVFNLKEYLILKIM